ncbi:MAG: CcmD family protein [Bryobacterales bacterium]|nr:CcmD family protein [Bryobacterales bacterium]
MDERNFQFMFYGFAVAWFLLAAYLLTLVARESKLRKEVDTLKRMLEERENKG